MGSARPRLEAREAVLWLGWDRVLAKDDGSNVWRRRVWKVILDCGIDRTCEKERPCEDSRSRSPSRRQPWLEAEMVVMGGGVPRRGCRGAGKSSSIWSMSEGPVSSYEVETLIITFLPIETPWQEIFY